MGFFSSIRRSITNTVKDVGNIAVAPIKAVVNVTEDVGRAIDKNKDVVLAAAATAVGGPQAGAAVYASVNQVSAMHDNAKIQQEALKVQQAAVTQAQAQQAQQQAQMMPTAGIFGASSANGGNSQVPLLYIGGGLVVLVLVILAVKK